MEDFTELVEDKKGGFDFMLKVFGFKPKEHYTYEALWELEELINDMYPEGHEPLPTTLLPFGHYLLRTLKANLFEYEVFPKQETVWDIYMEFEQKGGMKMMVYPFERANKFWRNREDRMSSLLEMISFLTENDASSPKVQAMADEDGWIKLPKGSVFRLLRTGEDGKPIEPKDDNQREKLFK